MRLKIKVRTHKGVEMPKVISKGEWIDLASEVDMELNKGSLVLIPLGVSMLLPEGFEAVILPRSSTPKKSSVLCANSQGVIDHSYNGNDDVWHFSAYGIKHHTIHKGDRICQFRIQLSQKATVWQKLKWLFSNGIELVQVDDLGDNSRGGFGSTGGYAE